jgi:hypothetical protein
MSIEVQSGSAPTALHEDSFAADEFDLVPRWSETVVTTIAAMLTIGFVSFVAVLMVFA